MKNILITFLLIICKLSSGQNLVPNGDFESYSSCPSSWSQIDKALFWTNPTTNIGLSAGTPDYFNSCFGPGIMNVPLNFFGSQQAHSGSAYAGLYVYFKTLIADTREYIAVSLNSALLENNCYHFEMYVNLGDICASSTHNLGVYFSDTMVNNINSSSVLPFIAQLNNTPGNYFNNQNWSLFSGDYTATGNETQLIIGNFKNDLLSDTLLIDSNAILKGIYVYIDDVSLTPCPTSGADRIDDDAINNIYPNPFTNQLTFTISGDEKMLVSLYNMFSQQVLQKTFANSITLDTQQFADGIYFYELKNSKGILEKGKVVKRSF